MRTRSTSKNNTQPNKPDTSKAKELNQPTENAIRVGEEFQATIPFLKPKRKLDQCLWSGRNGISDEDIENYCDEANNHFRIKSDQALNILYTVGYDLKVALNELSKYNIPEEKFNQDDAEVFTQAFMLFGKDFDKIKKSLPHKTTGQLVEHYYRTKKQQNYKTHLISNTKTPMKRMVRKQARKKQEEEEPRHQEQQQGSLQNEIKLIAKNLCPTIAQHFPSGPIAQQLSPPEGILQRENRNKEKTMKTDQTERKRKRGRSTDSEHSPDRVELRNTEIKGDDVIFVCECIWLTKNEIKDVKRYDLNDFGAIMECFVKWQKLDGALEQKVVQKILDRQLEKKDYYDDFKEVNGISTIEAFWLAFMGTKSQIVVDYIEKERQINFNDNKEIEDIWKQFMVAMEEYYQIVIQNSKMMAAICGKEKNEQFVVEVQRLANEGTMKNNKFTKADFLTLMLLSSLTNVNILLQYIILRGDGKMDSIMVPITPHHLGSETIHESLSGTAKEKDYHCLLFCPTCKAEKPKDPLAHRSYLVDMSVKWLVMQVYAKRSALRRPSHALRKKPTQPPYQMHFIFNDVWDEKNDDGED